MPRSNATFDSDLWHQPICALRSRAEYRRAEYLGHIAVARLECMGVDPQGHRGVRVAQAAGHGPHVGTGTETVVAAKWRSS